jgi:hypothetical protein
MEGRGYTSGLPSHFDVYRVDSPFVGACKRMIGKSARKHEPGDTFLAKRVASGIARSEAFPLEVRGRLTAHRWQFTDGNLWSYVIRTVRFADITIGAQGGIALPPVSAGIDVKTAIPPELSDPTIELSLILPWPNDESGLTVRDILRDELANGDGHVDEDELSSVLSVADNDLLDELDWSLSLEPGQLVIEPGEPQTATLMIDANEPGRLALAVAATNINNRKERSVSEIVVVEVDEDGTSSLLYTES